MSSELMSVPELQYNSPGVSGQTIRNAISMESCTGSRSRFKITGDEADRCKHYVQHRLDAEPQYPADKPGEAANDNGRVWKIYRDRVKDIDKDLLEGWNDTLTVLLTFAGLFSAACTGFLIEVAKNLEPDWQRATSLTVFAIYAHLNSTNPAPFEVPNPLTFAPPSDARWINGLWFTSLTLSLAVSLLAILAKQWLNEFKSRISGPASSPKMWAMRHSAFKGGLDRWGMDTFISALPLLLHTSLFLFLVGLSLLLLPLDKTIAAVVVIITATVSLFYVVAGVAPVIWGDCPTATPVLRPVYSLWTSTIGPALRWTFIVFYLIVIAYPGLVLFGLPYAAFAWCFTRVWNFPEGPVLRGLQSTLEFLVVKGETRHLRSLWRYRPTPFSAPACDQARILAKEYEPLREASVLSWMIRTLPVDSDINAALCAVGWLRAGDHHNYFHGRNQVSPLKHDAMQQAALDALDGIVIHEHPVDDVMIATILRACLFVAVKPLRLCDSTKQFLRPFAKQDSSPDTHGLRILSSSALHSHRDMPRDSFHKLANINTELAELIALSGLRDRQPTRVIMRLVAMSAEISQPRYPASIVAALEFEILKLIPRRLIGWSMPVCEDPRLRFIAALDIGLRHPDNLGMTDLERGALVSGYGAAARSVASDPKAELPPDLQHRLQLTSSRHFSSYHFNIADLNAIGTLLLRKLPDDRTSIDPVALSGMLHHFKRRSEFLPLLPETVEWINAAFGLPMNSRALITELERHRSVTLALLNSHLSLLRRVTSSFDAPKQSAWGRLLDLTPVSDSEHHLCELACPYTVQLLILHRSGNSAAAQDKLRELLPIERGASLIARGSSSRLHLSLHAKEISGKWWSEMSTKLRSMSTAWSPCTEYPDANSFLDAISDGVDCLDCAQATISIRWGSKPRPPRRRATYRDGTSRYVTGVVTASGSGDPLSDRGSGKHVSEELLESGLLPRCETPDSK